MASSLPRIDPLSARLPEYCVDWRFLLPLRPGARLLLGVDSFEDLTPYFTGLGVSIVVFGFGNFRPAAVHAARRPSLLCDPLGLPFAAETFDLAALPFGFPSVSKTSLDDLLHTLLHLLKPGGVFLMGISGRGGASMPAMKRALGRAGFGTPRVYGIAPDLLKPAYLMPLTARALGFYWRRRLSGKVGGSVFSIISRSFLPSLVQGLLPGYFMTTAKGSGGTGGAV